MRVRGGREVKTEDGSESTRHSMVYHQASEQVKETFTRTQMKVGC